MRIVRTALLVAATLALVGAVVQPGHEQRGAEPVDPYRAPALADGERAARVSEGGARRQLLRPPRRASVTARWEATPEAPSGSRAR